MKHLGLMVRLSLSGKTLVALSLVTVLFSMVPCAEGGVNNPYAKPEWKGFSASIFAGIPILMSSDFDSWIDNVNNYADGVTFSQLEGEYEWGLRLDYGFHPRWRVGLGVDFIMTSSSGSLPDGSVRIEAPLKIVELHLLHFFFPERSLNFGVGINFGWSRIDGSTEGLLIYPDSPEDSVEYFAARAPSFSVYAVGELRLGTAGSAFLEAGYLKVQSDEIDDGTIGFLNPDGSLAMFSYSGVFVRAGLRLSFRWLELG